MSTVKYPDLIEKLAMLQKGEDDRFDVMAFTLSTCQWCKKCKKWLKENDIQYRYIDVDQIKPNEKAQIITFLRESFQNRISYPFLVIDQDKTIVGYSPNKYDEVFN
ncbi:MAG: glutaredoxin family protein [Promethearchaeota archaeon]|nr:MAG: glutaredoxin family protein [Candidatus Lokiarchaeota archaeon]